MGPSEHPPTGALTAADVLLTHGHLDHVKDVLERDGCPILLYHLEPASCADLRREVAALKLRHVRVLAQGEELQLGRS
ncbi:MAG TPA: hypothetical protein VF341_06945 [Anaeromyxobacteraceae bacterium]